MRAAIHNPYLDTLGGGERYTLSFAKVLADAGWKVDVEWKNTEIRKDLALRFGMDFDQINFIPDVKKGDGYDLCFWVSDGSIPMLRARKNILHFQVPFNNVGGNNLLNKMKLIRIDRIICNSNFTKKVIDREFGVDSLVIYPPVDIDKFKQRRKENIILYVGRFSTLKQSKHQDILLEAFIKLYDQGEKDWKLILAGGSEVGAGDYVNSLRSSSKGYPVTIIEGPNFKSIVELYGKSKLFWSASGFGEDEDENPEKVEHFGITTVEAMVSGCIPIIYAAGGNKEIIKDGENGFLWHDTDDLISQTKRLIDNKKSLKDYSLRAHDSGKAFSYERFKSEIETLL